MAWTKARDISRYQGNWQDTGEPIVLIKMSGGDDGLYMDSQATSNYKAAIKAGKAVGGYHFGGGVQTAEVEAAFFLKAMSPLAQDDVYALDVEAHLASRADVVTWVQDFVNYVHNHIGVWPLVYMNLSTLNAHNWSAVLKNCGLWLADWAVSPDATVPIHYVYVMQQYNDGPSYDHDAFFGSVAQFKAYGYHEPKPVPTPTPPSPPKAVDVVKPIIVPAPVVVAPEPVVIEPVVTPIVTGPVVVGPQPIEKGSSMSKYRKALVALAGMVITWLSVHYGTNQVVEDVVMLATVLGVYHVPNQQD